MKEVREFQKGKKKLTVIIMFDGNNGKVEFCDHKLRHGYEIPALIIVQKGTKVSEETIDENIKKLGFEM